MGTVILPHPTQGTGLGRAPHCPGSEDEDAGGTFCPPGEGLLWKAKSSARCSSEASSPALCVPVGTTSHVFQTGDFREPGEFYSLFCILSIRGMKLFSLFAELPRLASYYLPSENRHWEVFL